MKTEDCHEMGFGICSNVIIYPGCGRWKEGFNLCRSFTNTTINRDLIIGSFLLCTKKLTILAKT